jgi:DNA-binding NarL/FixJ family response regulator
MIIVGAISNRPIVLAGLVAAVSGESSWRVGCTAPTAADFVAKLEANSCSVVIYDLEHGTTSDLQGLFERYFTVVAIADTEVAGAAIVTDPDVAPATLRSAIMDAWTKRPGADTFCTSRLTTRELEVLMLIGGGLANKQISSRLGVSMSTVKRHIENLMDKSGRRTRATLSALSVEVGHVRPETLTVLDQAATTSTSRQLTVA